MKWSQAREQYRGRLVAKYDEAEARSYDAWAGALTEQDEDVYLADILESSSLTAGNRVLDVGAGSGALTKILTRVSGLELTALEPSPAMCALLSAKPELADVPTVVGGCDCKSDRELFSEGSFDAVVSRQVVNSLYDPLVAFGNWLHWLRPGGSAIVMEGIYGRDGWTGIWAEEVDVTPLSACQSLATVAYLMEAVGFSVESVRWMERTNRLPSTRTKRYLVVATKPDRNCS